jgi:hypothetical protein
MDEKYTDEAHGSRVPEVIAQGAGESDDLDLIMCIFLELLLILRFSCCLTRTSLLRLQVFPLSMTWFIMTNCISSLAHIFKQSLKTMKQE